MTRATEIQPRHIEGLLTLMAQSSRGCFCRWWHFEGDDYAWQERCNRAPADNRAQLEHALRERSDEALGVVAVDDDGTVCGWLKLTAAKRIPKLYGRRLYRTLPCFDGDRTGVYVVSCMLVHPDARKQGVARALAAEAVEVAKSLGARALEALPRRPLEPVRDDELWTGPAAVFIEAGFTQVDGPDPYPVLRLELAP
jgi:GNAT superfamily N-acetyltransferase